MKDADTRGHKLGTLKEEVLRRSEFSEITSTMARVTGEFTSQARPPEAGSRASRRQERQDFTDPPLVLGVTSLGDVPGLWCSAAGPWVTLWRWGSLRPVCEPSALWGDGGQPRGPFLQGLSALRPLGLRLQQASVVGTRMFGLWQQPLVVGAATMRTGKRMWETPRRPPTRGEWVREERRHRLGRTRLGTSLQEATWASRVGGRRQTVPGSPAGPFTNLIGEQHVVFSSTPLEDVQASRKVPRAQSLAKPLDEVAE